MSRSGTHLLVPRRLRRFLLRAPRLFVTLWAPDDRELGELGEEIAARHLASRGWRILGRRVRTRAGEADLVVRSGRVLAVVEVKTGRAAPIPRPRGAVLPERFVLRWRPGARCDAPRISRLRAVGREIGADPQFSRHLPGRPARARVDLIEVLLEGPRRRFRVLHHEDLREPLA